LLSPQTVDERGDEGREVVAGWEDAWGRYEGPWWQLGGSVNSFIANNAAIPEPK